MNFLEIGINFLKHLLQTNPERRFSIEEAANHHWLTGPKTPQLFPNSKKLPVSNALGNSSTTAKALYLQEGFFKFHRNIATTLSKHSETNENNSETSQTLNIFDPNSKNNGSKTIENSPNSTEIKHINQFMSPQHNRSRPILSNIYLESLARNQINLQENKKKETVFKEETGIFEEIKEIFQEISEKKPHYKKITSSIITNIDIIEGETGQTLKIFPNITATPSLQSLFLFEQQLTKDL